MASWCDKLASTPTVGFKLDPNFLSGDTLLGSLTAITNSYYDQDKAKFTMEKHESFAVQFSGEDGYTYSIDPTKISVAFMHKVRAKLTSGGLPRVETTSEDAPYSILLDRTVEKAIELLVSVPNEAGRKLKRIGMVTTSVTNQEDMPPGVAKLLMYLGRPWNNKLSSYHMQITATLKKSETEEDRCIYTIVKGDEHEDLINFSFDWQRLYLSGKSIERKQVQDTVRLAQRAALAYFEAIAEGNEWDEKLLSSTSKR
ncbi:hypothetical protein [Methylobacterium sp. WL116]|uniref:hypothetical protein n=1 Tax=Methylobacterium sp. WL116 TaxID=2603889 RepID=UPI0011CAE585|nr:hypothetical protein [Methylobacterium sp. WL116]TXM91963.1 hypothetical protein FV223_13400 [Methylobacterium sp. WL116]